MGPLDSVPGIEFSWVNPVIVFGVATAIVSVVPDFVSILSFNTTILKILQVLK